MGLNCPSAQKRIIYINFGCAYGIIIDIGLIFDGTERMKH
jgi:hypothetical protein